MQTEAHIPQQAPDTRPSPLPGKSERHAQVRQKWYRAAEQYHEQHGTFATLGQLETITGSSVKQLSKADAGTFRERLQMNRYSLLTDKVLESLYHNATENGNVSAAKLWLQVVEGWNPNNKEADKEAEQSQGRVFINMLPPDPMPDYSRHDNEDGEDYNPDSFKPAPKATETAEDIARRDQQSHNTWKRYFKEEKRKEKQARQKEKEARRELKEARRQLKESRRTEKVQTAPQPEPVNTSFTAPQPAPAAEQPLPSSSQPENSTMPGLTAEVQAVSINTPAAGSELSCTERAETIPNAENQNLSANSTVKTHSQTNNCTESQTDNYPSNQPAPLTTEQQPSLSHAEAILNVACSESAVQETLNFINFALAQAHGLKSDFYSNRHLSNPLTWNSG